MKIWLACKPAHLLRSAEIINAFEYFITGSEDLKRNLPKSKSKSLILKLEMGTFPDIFSTIKPRLFNNSKI
jgi:hypothetical protein